MLVYFMKGSGMGLTLLLPQEVECGSDLSDVIWCWGVVSVFSLCFWSGQCIDRHGQSFSSLVRARHVIILGGNYSAVALSILPLPQSNYIFPIIRQKGGHQLTPNASSRGTAHRLWHCEGVSRASVTPSGQRLP